ncbi:hypothetical protein MM213_17935 [Belliella sp. R4-6]|uniref:Uncharacterized protein n=1 Tax=Belliella alkalica TaxID=1730871 RepID=A0ABS9VG10_9BACT|nr:hypothetical protein [Belliella alkalica]MCH7415385.1 hypothetical protein [Belliella alkalica]
MEILKRQFITRGFKKKIHLKRENPAFPEVVRSVGILTNTQEELLESKEVIFNMFGKSVEVSGFYNSKNDIDNGISSQDFSLWGKPNTKVKSFLEKKTDFILVPTLNLSPYLLYLLLHSKSASKIGFYSPQNRSYLDLMLNNEDKNLKENIQDLLDYFIKVKEAC